MQLSSKFKVGDEVVFTNSFGDVKCFKIQEIEEKGFWGIVLSSKDYQYSIPERRCVLEKLYNSPLEKALR